MNVFYLSKLRKLHVKFLGTFWGAKRRLDYIQPIWSNTRSSVLELKYPLKNRCSGQKNYSI